MTNPDDPAFNEIDYTAMGHYHDQGYRNLTKREYFAAMAMKGLLANSSNDAQCLNIEGESIRRADALIAELNKKVKP